MGKKAKVTFHPAYKVGDISPRLYGAFLEPIGSMVNGSMYNPKHPTADDLGFRRDYIDSLKSSGLPAVRLPGGNFVSGWDWKDSIGPRDKRKQHLDLAWFQYYTNEVGHDEYLQWAERVGFEPMYTINLGTGDINDAIYMAEYTNHEGGTYWSDLRKQYGHEKPYAVKIWYIGNEPDGPWQVGSWEKDPRGLGVKTHEVSKAMKWASPGIETVAAVSSSPFGTVYPRWDQEVLEQCYESVDYISLHHYHPAPLGDMAALLGGSETFAKYIDTEIALCDFIQTKQRSRKQMMLSLDEYGSMMMPKKEFRYGNGENPNGFVFDLLNPDKHYVRHDPDNWETRRMRARGSQMLQAITMASTMLTMINRADRVKIGCMTGGLGALAATDRENVWHAATRIPYTQLIQLGQGVALKGSVECDTFDVPGYAIDNFRQYDTMEGLPYIETAAALEESTGDLNVFVINRNWEQDTALELDVSGFAGYRFVEQIQLFSDDPEAANTLETPDAIAPSVSTSAVCRDGKVDTTVKKLSWNVFRFKKLV
ncbi:MAG: alpha-L-arabinofuranosidase [Clostridiaceae bacterium]|nr:alpha-L-arabinofuranosidase [Clostridiaceae bacterium]